MSLEHSQASVTSLLLLAVATKLIEELYATGLLETVVGIKIRQPQEGIVKGFGDSLHEI